MIIKQFIKQKISILFLSFVLFIIFLSVFPFNTEKSVNKIDIFYIRGDHFIHSLIYVPFFVFNVVLRRNVWFWLLIGLAFAIFAEWIQSFLPYRSFTYADMLSNIIGIFIGFLAYLLIKKYTTWFSRNQTS